MAEETLEEQLAGLSDGELLKALNTTLAKRQAPPTAAELSEREARDADEQYARYYPGRGSK